MVKQQPTASAQTHPMKSLPLLLFLAAIQPIRALADDIAIYRVLWTGRQTLNLSTEEGSPAGFVQTRDISRTAYFVRNLTVKEQATVDFYVDSSRKKRYRVYLGTAGDYRTASVLSYGPPQQQLLRYPQTNLFIETEFFSSVDWAPQNRKFGETGYLRGVQKAVRLPKTAATLNIPLTLTGPQLRWTNEKEIPVQTTGGTVRNFDVASTISQTMTMTLNASLTDLANFTDSPPVVGAIQYPKKSLGAGVYQTIEFLKRSGYQIAE
jgi:hypothetical protein